VLVDVSSEVVLRVGNKSSNGKLNVGRGNLDLVRVVLGVVSSSAEVVVRIGNGNGLRVRVRVGLVLDLIASSSTSLSSPVVPVGDVTGDLGLVVGAVSDVSSSEDEVLGPTIGKSKSISITG
jgi:hypothetical protein